MTLEVLASSARRLVGLAVFDQVEELGVHRHVVVGQRDREAQRRTRHRPRFGDPVEQPQAGREPRRLDDLRASPRSPRARTPADRAATTRAPSRAARLACRPSGCATRSAGSPRARPRAASRACRSGCGRSSADPPPACRSAGMRRSPRSTSRDTARTTMPDPRRGSTRFHSPSRRSASRSVGRDAPSWRDSSRSAGSRVPAGWTPLTMSASSFSNTASIAVVVVPGRASVSGGGGHLFRYRPIGKTNHIIESSTKFRSKVNWIRRGAVLWIALVLVVS